MSHFIGWQHGSIGAEIAIRELHLINKSCEDHCDIRGFSKLVYTFLQLAFQLTGTDKQKGYTVPEVRRHMLYGFKQQA